MQQQKSFEQHQVGTLYLVPTPIGNLEDMTFRAIRTLKEVSLIAAEDTRNTQKLLNHFTIETKQISFHEHNALERIPQLVARLQAGESIAQVSDAGMPCISDPGQLLVAACIAENVPVVALPGANAALTALIASGLGTTSFVFYGFLPRKKSEQVAFLTPIQYDTATQLFYESPYRVKKTLAVISSVYGDDRQVVICRELTKRFEEYIRGSLSDVLTWLADKELKGEICFIVAGYDGESGNNNQKADTGLEQKTFVEQVDWYMQTQHLTNKEAIKRVAKENGVRKQVVYQQYHEEEAK